VPARHGVPAAAARGQLVGAGDVDEHEVAAALIDAALARTPEMQARSRPSRDRSGRQSPRRRTP